MGVLEEDCRHGARQNGQDRNLAITVGYSIVQKEQDPEGTFKQGLISYATEPLGT